MTELRDGSINWDSHWNDRFRGSLLQRILEQLLNRSGFIKFINNTAVGIGKLVLDGKCFPTIIEVGSGLGTLSIAVGGAVAPAKVYLVDLVFAILPVASSGAAGGINANMFSCPLSDGCSELTCNTGTIEHFSDPVPIVKEMMRITKQGGCVMCVVPSKSIIWRAAILIRRLVERDAQLWVDQQLVFSPAQLVKIFQSAGLTDIHVARQTLCKLPLMNIVYGINTGNEGPGVYNARRKGDSA